jgi:hypothetical protein
MQTLAATALTPGVGVEEASFVAAAAPAPLFVLAALLPPDRARCAFASGAIVTISATSSQGALVHQALLIVSS